MLRSMYDFKATYAKTLSFKSYEYFILHQTNKKHRNWWEVINERGETGYIPSNYVESVTVSPAFYLQFLETCMNNVRRCEIAPQLLIGDQKEILLRLKEIKRHIENLSETNENSIGLDENHVLPPLLFRNSEGQLETVRGTIKSTSSSNTSFSSTTSEHKNSIDLPEEPIRPIEKKSRSRESLKKSIESLHEELQSERRRSDASLHNTLSNSSGITKISPAITSQSVYELVESVRINTQLSHKM